jgi:phospho-N-acetylmuramoyl-pentapeptide-transferase
MIYHLLEFFSNHKHVISNLNSIEYRAILSFFSSVFFAFIFCNKLIKYQKSKNFFQPIRQDGPESHASKQHTPTLGGVAIIGAIICSVILWGNLNNNFNLILIFISVSYAILGFVDDFLKIKYQNSKGVSAKAKLAFQFIFAIIACSFIYFYMPVNIRSLIILPIWKNIIFSISVFYVFFASFVLVGSSNAVNLTDGLDGLLTVPVIIVTCVLSYFAIKVSDIETANNLNVIFIPESKEILVFCAAICGSCLSFLWFNSNPAQIFMGDTGSLSLGATIGTISLIVKQELLFVILGILFVVEALSVIIQVYYYKYTGGKRFFRMAPIHHHFEKKGLAENKIVVRAWILSIIAALISIIIFNIK